jgi:uncharacterized membrane protein YqjE
VAIRESVHRAEEALVELETDDAAIRGALRDRECLRGSRIANATGLLSDLEVACRQLGGGKYFPTRRNEANVETADAEEKRLARAALTAIRRSINEFRDSRRAGLLRARNNLAVTVIFTGLTTLTLLALALLTTGDANDEKQRRTEVAVAATFYLIGAVVGLFRQLRAASAADAVIEEDYGLSHVRLIQIPLFSGLAAVGGVVLTRLLIELNLDSESAQMPSFEEILSFRQNPLGLIAAAVFGLTPTLLVSSLQRRAEQWKEDLQTSAPGEGAAVPAAPVA